MTTETTWTTKPKPVAAPPSAAFTPLPLHPLCSMFPLMSREERQPIIDDMLAHGYDPRHKCQTLDGQVLDGQNRQQSALDAGIPCLYEEWEGTVAEAVEFVVRENINKRHLSPNQRVMFVSRLAIWLQAEEEARARSGANLKKGDKAPSAQNCAVGKKKGRTTAGIAKTAKVSDRKAQQARRVLKTGIPELIDAVASDKLSMEKAVAISKLTAEQQLPALEAEFQAATIKRDTDRATADRPTGDVAVLGPQTWRAFRKARRFVEQLGSIKRDAHLVVAKIDEGWDVLCRIFPGKLPPESIVTPPRQKAPQAKG